MERRKKQDVGLVVENVGSSRIARPYQLMKRCNGRRTVVTVSSIEKASSLPLAVFRPGRRGRGLVMVVVVVLELEKGNESIRDRR